VKQISTKRSAISYDYKCELVEIYEIQTYAAEKRQKYIMVVDKKVKL
jgi:hypothetical protein